MADMLDGHPWKLVLVDESKEIPSLSPSRKEIRFGSPESLSHELGHVKLLQEEFPTSEEETVVYLYAAGKGWAYNPEELASGLQWSMDVGKTPPVYARDIVRKLQTLGYLSKTEASRARKAVSLVLERSSGKFKDKRYWNAGR